MRDRIIAHKDRNTAAHRANDDFHLLIHFGVKNVDLDVVDYPADVYHGLGGRFDVYSDELDARVTHIWGWEPNYTDTSVWEVTIRDEVAEIQSVFREDAVTEQEATTKCIRRFRKTWGHNTNPLHTVAVKHHE